MDTRDNTRSTSGSSAGRDDRFGVDDDRAVPDVRTAAERAAMRQTTYTTTTTPAGNTSGSERSIADLIKELRDEATTLIRQEMALARTEMSEKAAKVGRNAAYTGVGAVLLHLGLLFALLAASVAMVLLLGHWGAGINAWWLGPLIVGAVVGIIGAVMTSKGISTLKRQSLTPDKTVQSLKEDKQWLQEKVTQ
jgi:hypothetical protein